MKQILTAAQYAVGLVLFLVVVFASSVCDAVTSQAGHRVLDLVFGR